MTITCISFETANPSGVSICAAGMAVFVNCNLTNVTLLVGPTTQRPRLVLGKLH
jgi:hypothetical protein